jgi:hypothetical protein
MQMLFMDAATRILRHPPREKRSGNSSPLEKGSKALGTMRTRQPAASSAFSTSRLISSAANPPPLRIHCTSTYDLSTDNEWQPWPPIPKKTRRLSAARSPQTDYECTAQPLHPSLGQRSASPGHGKQRVA